jgi:hypothetical protein
VSACVYLHGRGSAISHVNASANVNVNASASANVSGCGNALKTAGRYCR